MRTLGGLGRAELGPTLRLRCVRFAQSGGMLRSNAAVRRGAADGLPFSPASSYSTTFIWSAFMRPPTTLSLAKAVSSSFTSAAVRRTQFDEQDIDSVSPTVTSALFKLFRIGPLA